MHKSCVKAEALERQFVLELLCFVHVCSFVRSFTSSNTKRKQYVGVAASDAFVQANDDDDDDDDGKSFALLVSMTSERVRNMLSPHRLVEALELVVF